MERGTFFQSSAFKILVFVAGTVILAAFLAPPLYWSGKHAVAESWLEGGPLDGLHDSLERAKFPRYFNRAVLLGGLLMLWPVLRWMNAGRSKREGRRSILESFHLQPNRRRWAHLAIGFVAAGGSLLLLGWFYVAQGWYEPKDTRDGLVAILLGALGTGLAVGFLEEFVFRGALYALLSTLLRPRVLFFTVAFVFAILHFFHAPRKLDIDPVTFTSGFTMVGTIFGHFFGQFASPSFLAAEFAVLFAIGLVLGYTREKTGSLWLGIGLHAGWVFGVKTLSPLTQRAFKPAEMMPWLGDTLRVGAVSCLVVCLTWLALWLWLRRLPAPELARSNPS